MEFRSWLRSSDLGCGSCPFHWSRATRANLRFYACCSLRSFVSRGGQWNFGRGWRSGGSCGRCTLGQSRATRANIAPWLVSVVAGGGWQYRSPVAVGLGNSVVNGKAVGVAVAVRLTRAVRLARISRWLVSVFLSYELTSFRSFGGARNFRCGSLQRSGLGCGRCALDRAVRLARISLRLACFVSLVTMELSSVSVGRETSVLVGEAVGVAVAVCLTRAVRLARISRWLVSVGSTVSSVAVGLGNFRREWRSGGCCGRCALDQSRATRSNIALARFCCYHSFGSVTVGTIGTSQSWLAAAVGVAVAVRLTRAVRLARISRWLVSSTTTVSGVGLGTSVVVGAAGWVAVAVRLTRAVRLARISALRLLLSPKLRQSRWGSELLWWLQQRCWSCGCCALDQSRATRSNIALACFCCYHSFLSFGGARKSRRGCSSGLGCGRCALGQSRAARSNLRFYACCCPRNFVSRGGQWNFSRGWRSGGSCGRRALDQSRATRANLSALRLLLSPTTSSVSVGLGISVVVGAAGWVAVAVRLTKAVRLARISGSMLVAVLTKLRQFRWGSELPSWLHAAVGVAVAVRLNQSRATRSNIALACFRCNRDFLSRGWARNFGGGWQNGGVAVAVRAWPEPCDSLDIALACFRCKPQTSSAVSVGLGIPFRLLQRYGLRLLCA